MKYSIISEDRYKKFVSKVERNISLINSFLITEKFSKENKLNLFSDEEYKILKKDKEEFELVLKGINIKFNAMNTFKKKKRVFFISTHENKKFFTKVSRQVGKYKSLFNKTFRKNFTIV